MTPAPKDDHTDRQALREGLAEITAEYFMATDPDRVALQHKLTKFIDAYTEQQVREARIEAYRDCKSKGGTANAIRSYAISRIAQLKASTREGE